MNKCFLLYPEKKIEVTISLEKKFYKEKEHFAIFIRAHFMWGIRKGGVRLVVGRPGFDSLAESDQKTLKVVFTASLLDVQHVKGLL